MTWYKVVDKDLKAKDGGKFDFAPYVKNKKWTPTRKPELCKSGWHVTQYWNMFLSDKSNRIFEVEVKDLITTQEIGVNEKAVASSIRLVKEFIPKYDDKENTGDSNTGYRNTGDRNTGDSNTGYRNTGNWNTGDSNTGYRNTGDSNTGYRNTGDRNTGHSNTGHWNTGDRNTGHSNTGHWNTGDSNTGYRNTGNWNTGHCNTGHSNTGNWNTASHHTGSFNTKPLEKVYLFNKEILKTEYDKIDFPNWLYFELKADYKKDFKEAFGKATKEELIATTQLPNFSYEVFEEISGITKRDFEKRGVKQSNKT